MDGHSIIKVHREVCYEKCNFVRHQIIPTSFDDVRDLILENGDQEKSTATYRIINTWLNKNGMWQILGGMSVK